MFIGTDPIFDQAYESDPDIYHIQNIIQEWEEMEQHSYQSQQSLRDFIVDDSSSNAAHHRLDIREPAEELAPTYTQAERNAACFQGAGDLCRD